ncbi:MAG TPA: hypothetical protein VNB06_13975 [Thermoanaerobaculia bacterium]|nr:hypothetical protein [Thermoanaerobaculia bacterium]
MIGVIGRAQRLYGVKIHAIGYLSNHGHELCSFEDVEQQALFMQHVQCNLSKEIGRLHDWPGAVGTAVSRDSRQRRGGAVRAPTIEKVELSPMPLWEHLTPEEYRARVRTMIEGIAEEAREQNRARGKRAMGVAVILARHPHSRPEHLDRSPAPQVHCSSKEKRAEFWEAFKEFMARYRVSAERLRHGELTAAFPANCFAPRRQFVPRQCEPEPRARAPGTR